MTAIQERIAAVLAEPKQHHQGSPLSYMTEWCANNLAADLMPLIREVQAEALREAATEMATKWPKALDEFEAGEVDDWLRTRADRLAALNQPTVDPGTHIVINPDCRDGKHASCSTIGWDEDLEAYAPCPCTCHQ